MPEARKTPDELIASTDESRREELRRLHEIVREEAPELRVSTAGSMIVYGPFRYRYATGREGDWARISVASRKAGLTLHLACGVDRQIEGTKHGVGCINIKRLDRVDLAALREEIRRAAVADLPQMLHPL